VTSSHTVRRHHPAGSKNLVALLALLLSTLLLMLAARIARADGAARLPKMIGLETISSPIAP